MKRHAVMTGLLLALAGCAPPPPGPDTPVARVGPVTITAEELRETTRRQSATEGRAFDRLPPGRAYESASCVLAELVDAHVVAQRATPESRRGGAAKADRLLARHKSDSADWRRTLTTAFVLEAEAVRLGRQPPEPTEAELRALYERDPARWAQPAEADVRIFVVNLPAGDRSIRARQACRAQVQAAPPTAAWEPLTVRRGQTQPQVEAMAFRLPLGQRSPVFQVGPGYAVMEVLARRPAVPRPFAAVRDQMRRSLVEERERRFYRQLRQEWRQEAGLEILLCHDTLLGPNRPAVSWLWVGLLAAAGAGLVWWSARYWRQRWLWAALAVGVLVRLALWVSTPYEWLSHDEEAHLEYVVHMAQHLQVPDLAQGFMFYQPPLYYYVAGLLGRLVGDPFAVRWYQGLALVLSVASLWLALDALRRLIAGQQLRPALSGIVALALATVPSWAYFATRINNDVLAAFWSYAAVWLLVCWWQEGRRWQWLIGLLVLGLGLLTKTTVALLLPVWGLAWWLRHQTPWRERLALAGLGGLLLLAVAGWFFGQRFLGERQEQLSGNVAWVPADSPMWLEHGPGTLLTFRPDRLWQQPYVHGAIPSDTRDNFWEYFLRTAWYGEFSFHRVPIGWMRALVVAGLGLAGLVVQGFVRAQRRDWRAAWPMTALWLVVLAGHVAYRQMAPLNGSQDFRYSIILLLPAAYFLAQGPAWSRWLVGAWTLLCLGLLGLVLR